MRASRKVLQVLKDGFSHQARPLQPFLLERFDGWNDSTMSLSSSECQALSLKELITYADDEGQERWDQLSLGYVQPSSGSLYLREEILKAHFNADDTPLPVLEPDSVNVCAPQEGIFLAIQAICRPGDHVIVAAPAYQSLSEIASSIGCRVEFWWPEVVELESSPLVPGTDRRVPSFVFRPETLQKLLRPKETKLVVANFPHNPTGAVPTHREFAAMVELVQESGSWFLVDEMYRGLEHSTPSQQPLPAIADCMTRGVSLGGVSKSYGLPGLRMGWLVNGQAAFQSRVAELKDYTSICPPAPSESLAFIALRSQGALWQRSRTILEKGLARLRQFVWDQRHHPKYHFEWYQPLGGTFAWVRFQSIATKLKASAYCHAVRNRTGLMMVPSGLFPECRTSDDRIRLTYGTTALEESLQVWKQDLHNDR